MTMKTMALFAVALMMALSAAPAQAQPVSVRIDVPFAFEFAGNAMPAGAYILTDGPRAGSMKLANVDGKAAPAYALGIAAAGAALEAPRVKFVRYGSSYYLRQVWANGSAGMQFGVTKSERVAMRAAAKADELTILAKRLN